MGGSYTARHNCGVARRCMRWRGARRGQSGAALRRRTGQERADRSRRESEFASDDFVRLSPSGQRENVALATAQACLRSRARIAHPGNEAIASAFAEVRYGNPICRVQTCADRRCPRVAQRRPAEGSKRKLTELRGQTGWQGDRRSEDGVPFLDGEIATRARARFAANGRDLVRNGMSRRTSCARDARIGMARDNRAAYLLFRGREAV